MEKRDLRRRMLALRAAVPSETRKAWNTALRERFLSLPLTRETDWVYSYFSFGTEADTRELARMLLERGVRLACPRVAENGKDMDFFEIRGIGDCRPGYRGIPEPGPDCRRADDPEALMILPGLAFTRSGDRLGYGGGFYDRFLTREPGHRTAAFSYPFQLLDTVPANARDRRADFILTPEETVRCETEKIRLSHGGQANDGLT